MVIRRGRLAEIRLEPGSRAVVFGDIHGDLDSLRGGVAKAKPEDVLVFLGDYADRGRFGVEVIEAIDGLISRERGRVVALMGNHESYSAGGEPAFSPCTLIAEAVAKRGSWARYFGELKSFISKLSIAATIPGVALFIHGGVPADVDSWESLERPGEETIAGAIWNDPSERLGLEPSPRGIGHCFGPDVTRRITKSLGVARVIRSHQPQRARSGPVVEHDGRVVTLCSTGVYGGLPHVLVIDPGARKRRPGAVYLDAEGTIEVLYVDSE